MDQGTLKVAQADYGEPFRFLESLIGTKDEGCIFWPFANSRGRARIRVGDRIDHAPRIMCELAHGPAPFEMAQAAHSCGMGHKGCVSPRHLRWATPKENAADKVLHGTHLATAKLTNEHKAEIAADTRPHVEICRAYGITRQTIWRIKRGERHPDFILE